MKVTARLLLAPAMAVAVAVSGCGSATAPASDPSSPAEASSTKPETSLEFLARLEAAAGKATTVTMKITGDAVRGGGSARLDSKDPAATYVLNVGGRSTILVVVDGVVYTKDGGDISARWHATGVKDAGLSDAFTPKSSFNAMRQGAKALVNRGPEDVEGTSTTRYELTVDARAAGAATGATPPPGMPDLVYSIWVDKDDLMRRISFSAEGSTMVVDYSGWGHPLEVVAPPADQVDQAPDN